MSKIINILIRDGGFPHWEIVEIIEGSTINDLKRFFDISFSFGIFRMANRSFIWDNEINLHNQLRDREKIEMSWNICYCA